MRLELPFPASSLAGHAKGNGQWKKVADTKKHRDWARNAALAQGKVRLPLSGDIAIKFRFEPPNRRGDRLNFPNRIKPYADGIADALGVNDSRFLPSYEFGEPIEGGLVTIEIAL